MYLIILYNPFSLSLSHKNRQLEIKRKSQYARKNNYSAELIINFFLIIDSRLSKKCANCYILSFVCDECSPIY